MRAFAASLGMTIREFAEHNRQHPELGYDKKCDQWLNILGSHDFVIAEGRLPHIFIPKAYHVLFVCDEDTRVAKRAQQDNRSSEEVQRDLRLREAADNERYVSLYGPNVLWQNDEYDLVVNSSMLSPRDIVDTIRAEHIKWIQSLGVEQFETEIESRDARLVFS
jgi:cytidylate kinase